MINSSSIFYHIYPLGLCGCPQRNDFCMSAGDGLRKLYDELPKIRELGVSAILIGPLFESSAHGYDTVDYFYVDRRLGTNDDLIKFVKTCHSLEIDVVLDAVFNHSGRDFFAFKDLQQHGYSSSYKDWYQGVRFDQHSPLGDNFNYANWAGCSDLVKYNLENPGIKGHIFEAVKKWILDFDIDGLRLDAADVLSFNFMKDLKNFTKGLKNGFWLMGEVVHGEYSRWANDGLLDSVTNYQLYKGLWSSFNDLNFFEVAYSLNQHFGDYSRCKEKLLYNFVDNHDVNRIASNLKNPEHIFSVYAMLFTIPGLPSIYYGSELGICGTRNQNGDKELRPSLPPFSEIPAFALPKIDTRKLKYTLQQLSWIRNSFSALKNGSYRQVCLTNTSFAFLRQYENQTAIVLFNADSKRQGLRLQNIPERNYTDAITGQNIFLSNGSIVELEGNSFQILTNISN